MNDEISFIPNALATQVARCTFTRALATAASVELTRVAPFANSEASLA